MARTDALMQLLDATLVAAITRGAEVFGPEGVAGWCANNNVSRATFYRHRARIVAERAYVPRSRRPRSCPHATPAPVVALIVGLRADLGADNGADNIGYRLHQVALEQDWAARGWRVPCRATIHKVLRRHGLVADQPGKRPKSSYRRFSYARPRDCYQIDATEVALAGGDKAVVFEVLDDCTRMLVASVAAAAETTAGALQAIRAAFGDFGVPAIVLSDNGSAFTTRRRTPAGRSRFTAAVTTAGARLIHSSPYHPQTCGKVERHHRTFKQWLATQPAPATLAQLQARCRAYQRYYNHERRHSVGNRPPAQSWQAAPDYGGPEHPPLQQDARVGTQTSSANGVVRLGEVYFNITRAHPRERITTILDGDHLSAYAADGQFLGHLQIDYTKRYQGKLHPAAA